MLNKARASVWVKIGAILITLSFVLALMPALSAAGLGDLVKSMFQGTTGSTGDTQAAVLQLKDKIKKNPKDVASLVALGNAYYDLAKYQNAITYYQKSLEIDAKNYDVMTDMGASYNALGQADKALEIFKQDTPEKADQAMAWYNMGVVYKSKNDTPNMRFAWERFLALQPTGTQADNVRSELATAAGSTTGTAK